MRWFAKPRVGSYEPPLKLLIFRDNRERRLSDSAAFHEIDEAVRKDELKEWWGRYGTWVVAAVVVVVVAAAGLVGWRQYDQAQRAAASAAYSAALAQIASDPTAARAELEKQAANAMEPYRSLAALIAAQMRPTLEEQATALTTVAPKLSASELSDLALVIAAFKSVDSPQAGDMMARIEALGGPDRAFRLSVRELQAMVAANKGDTKRARELWTEVSKDPAVPQGAAQRAATMLNLYGVAEAK